MIKYILILLFSLSTVILYGQIGYQECDVNAAPDGNTYLFIQCDEITDPDCNYALVDDACAAWGKCVHDGNIDKVAGYDIDIQSRCSGIKLVPLDMSFPLLIFLLFGYFFFIYYRNRKASKS